MEELRGKRVLVFCNLKASNFRGVKSEVDLLSILIFHFLPTLLQGMVLAACLDDKVEILLAPANSKAGDAVHIGERGVSVAHSDDLHIENSHYLYLFTFREALLMSSTRRRRTTFGVVKRQSLRRWLKSSMLMVKAMLNGR